VIYGNLDAEAIMFEGVDKALAIKGVDVRLFGKPQSFKKRRMGVVILVRQGQKPNKPRRSSKQKYNKSYFSSIQITAYMLKSALNKFLVALHVSSDKKYCNHCPC